MAGRGPRSVGSPVGTTVAATGERVEVHGDSVAVSRRAADLVRSVLRAALEERGEAHLALTGGSSAIGLYRELTAGEHGDQPPADAATAGLSGWSEGMSGAGGDQGAAAGGMRRAQSGADDVPAEGRRGTGEGAERVPAIDWSRVHLWWGDDRFVPSDHPESNAGTASRLLLGIAAHSTASGSGEAATDARAGLSQAVAVPIDQVHPFPVDAAIAGGHDGGWAAQRYEAELLRFVPPAAEGTPVFDLVLLGVGSDGHILSVFPEQGLPPEGAPLASAVSAPRAVTPHIPRLTLHPRVVAVARHVLVVATGSGKAEVLARVLDGDVEPARLPAQLARRRGATWLLDREAAAGLEPPKGGKAGSGSSPP